MIPTLETPSEGNPLDKEKMSPEKTRKQQLAFMRLFIQEAKAGRMDRSEIINHINKAKDNEFITNIDETTLVRELNEALGVTPEQIRENKLGLIRFFIGLAEKNQMDRSEVIMYIFQIRKNNFITDADSLTLTQELDKALGITPEQIRENKLGFIRLFIKLVREEQMEDSEVAKKITQVKEKGFITDRDEIMLIQELNEVVKA